MNVAGVDVSTHAIDIVELPLDLDDHRLRWHRFDLTGSNAIDRASEAASQAPRGTFWDDIAEVAIERPFGPGGDTTFALHLVVGVVVAFLPDRLRPPLFLHPSQWRSKAGIGGNASKRMVADRAHELFPVLEGEPQDACDAALIAHAGRVLNAERLERAA